MWPLSLFLVLIWLRNVNPLYSKHECKHNRAGVGGALACLEVPITLFKKGSGDWGVPGSDLLIIISCLECRKHIMQTNF